MDKTTNYQKYKEKRLIYQKNWYEKNKEKVKAYQKEYQAKYRLIPEKAEKKKEFMRANCKRYSKDLQRKKSWKSKRIYFKMASKE